MSVGISSYFKRKKANKITTVEWIHEFPLTTSKRAFGKKETASRTLGGKMMSCDRCSDKMMSCDRHNNKMMSRERRRGVRKRAIGEHAAKTNTASTRVKVHALQSQMTLSHFAGGHPKSLSSNCESMKQKRKRVPELSAP